MTLEVLDILTHPEVTVNCPGSMTAVAVAAPIRTGLSVSCQRGLRAAASIIAGLAIVAGAPEDYMTVTECEMVQPIYRSEILSNFIEFAGRYVMTADGKIFWVKEE